MAGYSDSALRGWRKSGTIKKPGASAAAPARTLSESLGERGSGSLVLERRDTGVVEAYFGWRVGGAQKRKKLGTLFDIGSNGQERGIAHWRSEALRVSAEVREHGGLEERAAHHAERAAEAQRIADAEAAAGTFRHLWDDYVMDRRGKVRPDQIRELDRILQTDLGMFPHILNSAAHEIRPHHIRTILTPIWDRGSKRQASKVRTFIRAAFAYGIAAEFSLGRTSGRQFGIEINPADAVTVPVSTTPGTRSLTDAELALFWNTIEDTKGVGPVVAKLLKFVIATGGQRIEQVMREPWSSFDIDKKVMRLIDAKGRGGVRRVHLVPLSDLALGILRDVAALNSGSEWPWTTTGKTPISVTTPVHAIEKWIAGNSAVAEAVQKFTPRDLRRTCAQAMQRIGVDDRASDLLQSHGVSGVVATHYRNDPSAYLPTKWVALNAFTEELKRLLSTRAVPPVGKIASI